MTASAWYKHYLNRLSTLYDPSEADSMARLVFEKLTGLSRSAMLVNPEQAFDAPVAETLANALDALEAHQPVQYVLKEAWFCGLPFLVEPGVLIPRPETEELTEKAIRFLKGHEKRVLEIGTGSGCIAVGIKKNCPEADITAIDLSDQALAIAARNAERHECTIDFRKMDFLDAGKRDLGEAFDLIISNPPYIPLSEKAGMPQHVIHHEPGMALFVPDDEPLLFYKAIASFAKSHLNHEGKIMVETHENLAIETARVFEEQGFQAEVCRDMFGKDRMVIASLVRSR